MKRKIEIKPDKRRCKFSDTPVNAGGREIFVDGELWGRTCLESVGPRGVKYVLHQSDPLKDSPERCYRINIGKGFHKSSIYIWSDRAYHSHRAPGEKPIPLADRIRAMVEKAIADKHLRSPAVIARERKQALDRLRAKRLRREAARHKRWATVADATVRAIRLAPHGAQVAVLTAMKWAVKHAT